MKAPSPMVAMLLAAPLAFAGAAWTILRDPGPDAAERAFAAGRFADALRLREGELARAGGDASPELLLSLATAAFRAGDMDRAETAAAAAEGARPAGETAAAVRFLRGSIAWARSEAAELRSRGPRATPMDHAAAVASAEDALVHWQRAAMAGEEDRPAARRNAERALLRLAALREKRRDGTGGPPPPPPPEDPLRTDDGKPAPDTPDAPEVDQPEDVPGDPGDEAKPEGPAELAPAAVSALAERLATKEKEKWDLRRRVRRERADPAERDW